MSSAAYDAAWQSYAVSGRPDFLNYLHRGDVTWNQLWGFYRQHPADPSSVLRLTGLFHAFLSQDFDRVGCVLDQDTEVYRGLQEWAGFATEWTEFVPEEKVCEALAGLLGQSLISPLYYEAVFNVFLEASLKRSLQEGSSGPEVEPGPAAARRLRILLPDLALDLDGRCGGEEDLRAAIDRRHAAWNQGYVAALGCEEDDLWEDGGEA
jgi:hypothetical protein